jgi:hypothetical protein
MSLKISKKERKTILEQHQSLKNIILKSIVSSKNSVQEQQGGAIGLDTINKAKQVCKGLTNAEVTPFKSRTLTNGQSYAALSVTVSPNEIKYYTTMPDAIPYGLNKNGQQVNRYTVFVINPTGGMSQQGKDIPTLIRKEWWSCSNLNAPTAPVGPSAETLKDIENEVAQGGWTKKADLLAKMSQSEIDSLYQKHPKYDLYKLKVQSGKTGGFTPQQQAFIDAWTSKVGGTFKNVLTDDELASGQWEAMIVPGSEARFPNGLTIYKSAVKSEETEKSKCRDTIERFYNMWRDKTSGTISTAEFTKLKDSAQACKDRNRNWGGVFSKVDDYIKILTGNDPKGRGPLSYGEDSKFRLK